MSGEARRGRVGGAGAVRLVGIDSLQVGAARVFDLTTGGLEPPEEEVLGIDLQGCSG